MYNCIAISVKPHLHILEGKSLCAFRLFYADFWVLSGGVGVGFFFPFSSIPARHGKLVSSSVFYKSVLWFVNLQGKTVIQGIEKAS